jgi:hypothetical protein
MFTVHSSSGLVRRSAGLDGSAGTGRHADPIANRKLRAAALCGVLALALPGISSAQSIGTMQVAARVVPASAGWSGVSEAGLAAQAAVQAPSGRLLIRRSGLVHSIAEIRTAGSRRVVLVTIQHPHN